MKTYGYYPLGFRRALGDYERKLDATADKRVADEYIRWQQDRAAVRCWENYRTTVTLAAELLGDFTGWLTDQQYNPNITRQGWAFLVETVNFINTGRRCITPAVHAGLIYSEVLRLERFPPNERKETLVKLLPSDDSQALLARWIRQQNGQGDMLCSLNVFFGNVSPDGFYSYGV